MIRQGLQGVVALAGTAGERRAGLVAFRGAVVERGARRLERGSCLVARREGGRAFLSGRVTFAERVVALHEGRIALADDLVALAPGAVALLDRDVRVLAQRRAGFEAAVGFVAFRLRRFASAVRLVAFGFECGSDRLGLLELDAAGVEAPGELFDPGELVGGGRFEVADARLGLPQLPADVVAVGVGLADDLFQLGDATVRLVELAEHALAVGAEALPFRFLVGDVQLELGGPGADRVELGARRVVRARVALDRRFQLVHTTRGLRELLLAGVQRAFVLGE